MKGKIILGLATIGVTISSLSVVACSNKNKPKAEKEDGNITKSAQEKNKYPELNDEFRRSQVVTKFIREKGVSYFEKYEKNRPIRHYKNVDGYEKDIKIDISLDGLWFVADGNWGWKTIVNNKGETVRIPRIITLNYHEAYDYAHTKNPNLYPYLNNN